MKLGKSIGLLLVSSVALLAAGCGSDEGSDESSDQVASLEKKIGQLEQENQKLEEKVKADEDSPGATNGEGNRPTVEYPYFETPSGNIACSISESHARCEIRQKTWNPGPAPSDCNLDWGYGLIVEGESEGRVLCAGDTVRTNDAPTLQYGTATQTGSFVCSSEESGVTCTNNETGHGFEISRDSYDRF